MAVWDTATVNFEPAIAEAGSWCFEIESTGVHCATCARLPSNQIGSLDAGVDTPPLPAALAAVPRCITHETWSADSIGVTLQVDSTDGVTQGITGINIDSVSNLEQLVPSLTYRAYLDDELKYDRDVEFAYQMAEPNGQGCGVVHHGVVKTAP